VSEQFSLRTVVAVEELLNHDMIYVYHHIQTGSQVELTPNGTNLFGDRKYQVEFKGFIIGYTTVSGIMKDMFADSEKITAQVFSMTKDRYMPIKELDLQIGIEAMKKVG
jgi:hypothetical protein